MTPMRPSLLKLPLLALALAGCKVIASPYEAEQRACVEEAGTRAAADACRCRVKASFGNPCDAGTEP
jgi:hypothetical protein